MLNYLLAPTFQFTNTAGRPLSGGAYLEVYIHGTRTKYYCASDFEGNLHPFQIPLDSLGANVVLAEDTGTYDVYAYNRFGSLSMSRYNVKPGAGGSGMGSITSSDGSIEVTPTSTGVDLKVNGQDPSVIRATADDLDADGSFTFSALVIEGQDLSVDEHGRIRMEDGWYHYDATVKLVWEGSVNDSAAVQLYTTLNSDVMDFDLSYAHDETVQLGGELKITTGGTSFVLGVSGLPSGMSAQLVDLGIHTITGHGDAAGYEAGDGIIIDDHEISVDPAYVQEKLTAGDNITISDNVISATNTTYTAGANVQISNENVISATDTTYTAGTGLNLSGTEFSVDTSEIQEKLTAGSNIVIEGNTISATAEPQLQADWDENDSSSVQYIQHKPANLVQDANYVHTDNNFTNADVSKLGGIEAGAEVNVQSNWNESNTSSDAYIQNKPDLSVYATNSDLTAGLATKQDTISDLATIRSGAALGASAVQPSDLATVATTGSYDDLTDKPDLSVYATDSELTAGLATKQDTISDLSTIRSGAALGATATQPADLAAGLATKQDVISDLATIRSGAAFGATAVQPGDLATVASTGSYDDLTDKPDLSVYATDSELTAGLATKQDTLTAGSNITITNNVISATAAPQEQADWAESDSADVSYIKNKPAVKPVVAGSNITITEGNDSFTISATSTQQVQADWDEADSSDPSYIQNKPTIPSGVQLVPSATSSDADKVLTVNAQGVPEWADSQGLFIAQYGTTTYAEVDAAVADNKIVYCYVKGRMAFLAYIGATSYEFQYYRSNNSSSGTDSVFVYKVYRSGWETTERTVKAGNIDYPVTQVNVNGSSAMTGSVANITIPAAPTVDQTYDATSANAQSGVAVAEAISTKQDVIPDLDAIRVGAVAGSTAVQPGSLATVAFSGDYTDLSNKPSIPVIGTITL